MKRTITISLEAASMVAKMLPNASTMNFKAMEAAAEFLTAVLGAPDEQPADEPEDDGLGDRATR